MDQNWAALLQLIYEHDQEWHYFGKGKKGIDRTHPFVEKTDLTASGAKAAFSFLGRNGLVEDAGEVRSS